MTVSTSANRADYVGNGSTTAFPVPFYFPDPTSLQVLSTVVLTGVSTTLTLNSDYTVAGAGVSAGGTVTMSVAPAGTVKISILLNLAYVQNTHYVPNDPFPAASHEAALDYLTLLAKQTAEVNSRSIQVPQGESGSVVVLPSAPARANTFLGFDLNGALVLVANAVGSAGALALQYAGSTGSSLIGFIGRVAGSLARTLQAKLQETPSVTDRQAVGDGATSNTAAFAAMEADTTFQTFYVPDGIFLTGQSYLKKHYFGPGSLILTGGGGVGAIPASLAQPKTTALAGVNSSSSIGQRTDVLIGDSIGFGFGVTGAQSWWSLCQQWLNAKMAFGQGSFQSGGNMTRCTQAGTITTGTNGPGKQSLILAVGASLTFTADYIDFVGFWFERSAGAGTITVKQGATTIGTYSCAGATGSNIFSGVNGTSAKGALAQSYSLTCSVAPVEIDGIFAMHNVGNAATNPNVLELQAFSGYATTDFTPAAVVAAIKAQIIYSAYFPRIIIALGTNNIYNVSKATTSAQYKADLISIITQIGTTQYAFVLAVPLRAGVGTYSPVLEPFDNYRKVVYEVSRQYGLDVIDFSELDLVTIGAYQADNLHPNNYGHACMADFAFKRLYGDMIAADRTAVVTPVNGASAVGGVYATPSVSMGRGGKVSLAGTLVVTGIAKTTTIATIPADFAPLMRRVFTVPTLTSTGMATLLIDPTGNIQLFDFTAATITNVSLDNVSYFCG